MAVPKISISCPTTCTASIFEDIKNYSPVGGAGIGLWESNLADCDDAEVRDAVDAAGLAAAVCCPAMPFLIPDPFFAEADDPDARPTALSQAIRRISRFDSAAILVTTGRPGHYGIAEPERIVTERLKPAADVAGELGITLGIEPYRHTSGTVATTPPEVLEMAYGAGRPNVKLIVDVWHYWDVPDGLKVLAEDSERLVGVQPNDWREPTRGWSDGVLPGDGTSTCVPSSGLSPAWGYHGWYDVEVLSGNGLFGNDCPDSAWSGPPRSHVTRLTSSSSCGTP